MDYLGWVLLAALLVAPVLLRRRGRRRLDAAWQAAANCLGLGVVRAYDSARIRALKGRVGGVYVEVDRQEPHTGMRSDDTTRLRVELRTPPPRLVVSARGVVTRVRELVWDDDVETGDPAFDDAVVVRGTDRTRVLATLGDETRRLLREAVAFGATVTDGSILWQKPGGIEDSDWFVSRVQQLVALARRLDTPDDVVGALVGIVESDPCAGVRRRALESLHDAAPHDPRLERAARSLLSHADVAVRLAAVPYAGPAGGPVARAIALEGLSVGATVRAKAVLLAAERSALETHELGGLLLEGAPVGAVAAEALGAMGARDALGPLLDALDRDGEPDLRVAVLGALGRVADVEAVGRIEPLTRGALAPLAVKRAAREAIAAIQGRVDGDPRGGLALAQEEAGDLSIAEGGELSEAAPTKGPPPPGARQGEA